MPGYDRSGPLGDGPRTGGGFGLCGGSRVPYSYRGWPTAAGRGWARGGRFWGGGRGRCGGWGRGIADPLAGVPAYGGYPAGTVWKTMSAAPSEAEALQAAAVDLREELRNVEARLAELEKTRTEEQP